MDNRRTYTSGSASTEFNWQAGEQEWDLGQGEENPAVKYPLWPRLLGILLLMMLAATIIIYQLIQKRIETPIPPPDQLIELTCRTEGSGVGVNYWYDPGRERWLDGPELPESSNALRVTALDENSFLVEETTYEQDGPHWRLSLWEDETLSLLVETAVQRQRTLAATDPTRRKLIFTEFIPSSGLLYYYLLDIDACQSGECKVIPLPGRVIWSPDGRRTLISHLEEPEFTLYLGDTAAVAESYLASGFARAWIDNERFIYQPYNQPDNNEMQWIVGNIAGEVLAVLNTPEMASLFLPDFSTLSPRLFNRVESNPFEPDELLVTVYGDDSQGSERAGLILRYNWRTGVHERLLVTPDTFPVSQISPDGRWLAIQEQKSPDSSLDTTLTLLDLTTAEKQSIDEGELLPSGDIWSADGRWLLSLHPDLLYLLVPDDDYQLVVQPPTDHCERARWIPEDSNS